MAYKQGKLNKSKLNLAMSLKVETGEESKTLRSKVYISSTTWE